MPGYKVHLLGAAAVSGAALFGLSYFHYFQPEPMEAAMLVAIALLAALFPDTDTASMGRHLYYGIMAFVDVVLMLNEEYKWAAILGFCAMLPAMGSHRGWTHTWWAMLAVPLPILLLPMLFYDYSWQYMAPYYLAAVVGYFSHLALDREF